MTEMGGLHPGGLHSISISSTACEKKGETLHKLIQTDVQALDVTAQLTSIQFTSITVNSCSQANLTESSTEQIHQSPVSQIKSTKDSDQVQIKIQSFSKGCVKLNFTLTFSQSHNHSIRNVSKEVDSSTNSSKYTANSANINVSSRLPTTTSAMKPATVTSVGGALSEQCRVAAITVTLAKDFLLDYNIQENSLYLGLMGCRINGGNSTHVQLTVAWNECAIQLIHNESHCMASVTLFSTVDPYTSPNGTVEVPTVMLQVPIMCTYSKEMLISADFGSMGYDAVKDVFGRVGALPVLLQLMNSSARLPLNHRLSSQQDLVLEVSINSTSEQIKLIINKCWATSTQDPEGGHSYTFLENSCALNSYTQVLMNGNSTTSRVAVRIFSFVNLTVVYLHCQVQLCIEMGSNTCTADCLQRTARTAKTVGRAFGSSGPLLKSDEELGMETLDTPYVAGISCLGIGLSLFFIIGFFCLFYYQRNRIGHHNFNVKPKQENFTYIDINP
ncbi:uromodulin-like 1 [Oryzias latipes]|nr:uromodulin-like 1 [Oryzias latipes]